jgi:DNA-binding GntR family transcriptional regulator
LTKLFFCDNKYLKIKIGAAMAKIKTEVLSSKVYKVLKEMTADYRFQPGVRLNVEKVAKELGVSRTPVWEAVRRLEQEGLLKNIPNRGVFMIEMTLEKAFEVFQVRETLERLAGRLAAQNVDDKLIQRMAKCLGEQLEAVEEGDLFRYSQLDFDFHSMIYKMTRNIFLQEVLDSIKTKMQPFNIDLKPILMQLYQNHVEILEALQEKDPDRVEEVLNKHNEKVLNHIKEGMKTEAERIRVAKELKDNHNSVRGNRQGDKNELAKPEVL